MATPSSLMQIWLIARFELIRVFMTKRGLFSLLAFALAWFVILRYPIAMASNFIISGEETGLSGFVLGQIGLQHMAQWAVVELAVYWQMAFYLFPAMILLISSDQTVTDRTRGTARFLVLRMPRWAFFIGRFLGNVLLFAILMGVTLATTLLFSILRESTAFADTFYFSVLVWLNLVIVMMPFIALMAFFATLVSSPKLTSIAALLFLLLGGWLVNYLIGISPSLDVIGYLMPGMHFDLFSKQNAEQLSHLLLIPVFQTALFVVLGCLVISRRSV